MKLLICGGRHYHDYNRLAACIMALPFTPTLIIEGGARGADALARRWAIANGIHFAEVPALWDFHSKAAGAIRNTAMLELKPDFCLAMPGQSGTNDMATKCEGNGVPTWRVT